MAAFIAQREKVARVILFSSPWDFQVTSGHVRTLAPWISGHSKTPPERWYGGYHEREKTADLIAQAEHDEMASAVLLTPVESFARAVSREVESQLNTLVRGAIARRAIDEYGAVFITESLKEAVEIVNRFAPEHLELVVDRPKDLLKGVRNAGAVFLGPLTPEAFGDYLAGPNHILPTGGTARFSSPLGVHDFIKRTNIISFSRSSFDMYGDKAVAFAGLEGLEGHGNSVRVRKGKRKGKKS